MAVLTDSEKEFLKMVTKTKAWTNKEFSRFWAVARELEYTKDDVHQLFGLESMKDFSGSLDEAIAILEQIPGFVPPDAEPAPDFPPEDEDFDPQPPARTDAPAATPVIAWNGDAPLSFNVEAYEPGGYKCQLTMRETDVERYLERIARLLKWMHANKYRPVYGNGGNGNGQRAQSGGNGAQPSGEAPICNLHNRAMKRSKFADDEWICTAKLADGSYCTEKVKDG